MRNENDYIQKMMDTLLFSLFVWALILKDTENNTYPLFIILFALHNFYASFNCFAVTAENIRFS